MQGNFKIDYDFEEDLLYCYCESKKATGSIEFGELVIDLKKSGEIVGLEIFGASKYLSELTSKKITKENLKEVEKAKFSFLAKKGIMIIKIFFSIKTEQVPATIAIQNMAYKSPITVYSQ